VTSAFIIEVNSQLQPDPNEETAALLRVLIYKIDNTTFGGDVPPIPLQWTGPPHTIVQVQAVLYASLAASLFSAFLAMLGKQWLNQYMSTNMRGTAIERGRNRQQKLNGIVTWCFDYVMESLPLMLQGALFLLGCALSRYLWEINTTIASVILGVTSLGILLYLLIVIAGSVFASCPYQTPGSRILRSATSALVLATLAVGHAFRDSATVGVFQSNAEYYEPWWSRGNIKDFLRDVLDGIPPALASDGAHLGQAMIWPLVAFLHWVYTWLPGAHSTPAHGMDQQTTSLDFHCTSWILQTSLDKNHHLSAMEHLVTILALSNFDPSLVTECFGALVGCLKVTDGTVMVTQGLEKLAMSSAVCLLYTFSHLSAMGPSSGVLVDVCQQYARIFPPDIKFNGLPFHHIFGAIHFTLHQGWRSQHQGERQAGYQQIQWRDYKLSSWEDITFIHALTKLAQSEYQRREKVPCWILRFVLHTLSINPLPSILITVNCLSIIAISLDCDISGVRNMASDERYAHF
jgi:hypothetical protein